MNRFITNLTQEGARLFLYIPGKLTIERAATFIITHLNQVEPSTEIIVVTRDFINIPNDSVINLNLSQVNQPFLDILFGLSSPRPIANRILIIEAAINLGQFIVPRDVGRILVISSPFKSMEELNESARFLTGPDAQNVQITPFDTGKFLGTIGYQFVNNNLNFDFKGIPITIPLSQAQYDEYLLRVERERILARREPFSALQALNFMYPSQLQFVHNLPREERPYITPDDLIREGGWIDFEHLQQIKQYSPKLEWLIQYFQQNTGKHVLYTTFNESNGVRVISSFLQLAGFQVIQITGNDRQSDRHAKVETFNSLSQNSTVILVSNLYAFSGLNNVKSLIMFEQHPYDNILNSYLKYIAIRTHSPSIPVIFLIAAGPNGQTTLDVINYTNMARLLNQKDAIIEILTTGQLDPSKLDRYSQAFGLSIQQIQSIMQDTNGQILQFKKIFI